MNHYSRFSDQGPSSAERVIRTYCNLLRESINSKGDADCVSELPSVLDKYETPLNTQQ